MLSCVAKGGALIWKLKCHLYIAVDEYCIVFSGSSFKGIFFIAHGALTEWKWEYML